MSKTRVKWIEEKTFMGTDIHGRSALISSNADGPGASPMQMLLFGLGGCTLVDVVGILQKQRQPFDDVEILFDAERGEDGARPWEYIHMHYIVTGTGLEAFAGAPLLMWTGRVVGSSSPGA